MKILHIGLLSCFTEKMKYQENYLVEQHLKDGHEVLFISNDSEYKNGKLIKSESKYIRKKNFTLLRKSFIKIFNENISSKFVLIKKLNIEILKFKPDIILYHGCCGMALLDVVKYKKNNPKVKLYLDCHEDFNNSGRNILSKYILHKFLNRLIIKRAIPYVEKILYISYESKKFLKDCFNITEEKMEFYPLGGIILSKKEREEKRTKYRQELKLEENDILFIHSGKMDKSKKTEDIINAFFEIKDQRFKLILIGTISEEINYVYDKINKDQRIKFLGWKSGEELTNYLCSGDVYLQPGSQSATMQNALCNENMVVLYPYESHFPYMKKNGFFVKNKEDIKDILTLISQDTSIIKEMKKNSLKLAEEMLDYTKLAREIYK